MESAKGRVERELERIDLLLHREVMRLRARYQLSLDEFRGLYISDEQVDALLRESAQPFDAAALTEQAETIRVRNRAYDAAPSNWARVALEFDLDAVEQDLLFLTLAPEIDVKYEALYGYLNNDVTRKFVTRDLARRVFWESGPRAIDRALAAGSTLFQSGLLVMTPSAAGFRASAVLAETILANDAPPRPPLRLTASEKQIDTVWGSRPVINLKPARELLRSGGAVVLAGNCGRERLATAEALCVEAGLQLLVLDARDIVLDGETDASLAHTVALQARLRSAAIYVANGEVWFDSESRPHTGAQGFVRGLERVPLFLACNGYCNWRELLRDRKRVLELSFPPLPAAARAKVWSNAISAMALDVQPDVIDDLSRQFVFTASEICSVTEDAADTLSFRALPVRDALFSAARAHSAQGLRKLAAKVSTSYRWKDLILPRTTAAQIKEVAAAIRNRELVYTEWGVSPGAGFSGLNLLLSGASGTGKTMSAGIIAAESGVDLYRIDLAGLVSKYIGETEKNLDRIFTAARSSNAILFFDEADALFGNRSEAHDAHDRYANIEVAYLLQKLEQHDGVVILASNLPRNIDAAFARRIQFHVEFPLPAEPDRERLWRGMFPSQAPLASDVDFQFLARQFILTGGQIRSVSLDAAFLAAADGRRITMPLIVKAAAREFMKQGRMPSLQVFQQYLPLIGDRY